MSSRQPITRDQAVAYLAVSVLIGASGVFGLLADSFEGWQSLLAVGQILTGVIWCALAVRELRRARGAADPEA